MYKIKCSICGQIEERQFDREKVTCFTCKKQRNLVTSKKNRNLRKKKISGKI